MCCIWESVKVNDGMLIGAMRALRSSSVMALMGMRANVTWSRKC